MKTRSLYQRISIIIAVISFAALVFLSPKNKELPKEEIIAQIQTQIEELNEEASSFFQANGDSIFQENDPWSRILYNELTDNGWEIYFLEFGELNYWSSNEFELDTTLKKIKGNALVNNDFGWNVLNTYQYETSKLIAVYPLYRKGTAAVNEIQRLPQLPFISYDLDANSESQIVELDQLEIIPQRQKGLTKFQVFLLLVFIISAAMAFIAAFNQKSKWLLIYPLVFLLIRIGIYYQLFLTNLQAYELFNPGVYASSFLLGSLGDLLLHSIVSLTIVLSLSSIFNLYKVEMKKTLQYILITFSFLVSVFLADMQYGIVEGLVLDSNISYDIINLQTINLYSIISILLIGLNAITWLILTRDSLKWSGFENQKPLLNFIFLASAIVLFYAFQFIDASRTFDSLFQGILLAFLCWIYVQWVNIYKWKNILFLTFVVALLSSSSIRKFDKQRDLEHLKFHASKLVSEKDLEAEYRFEDIENLLVGEFLDPQNFVEINENRDLYEKRLRHLYFSSSLNQYEVKLLSFDSENKSIDTSSSFEFEFLSEMYNNAYPTISKNFYQIKKPSEINGYIAKFENCDQDGHYGNVFLLLEPKVIQSTYVYPPLLRKKSRRQFFNLSDYSFAIYNQGKLLKQKGDVAYELRYNEEHLKDQNDFWGTYSHFISKDSDNTIVVLSTSNSFGLKWVSTLSFTFLFYSIFILLAIASYLLLSFALPYLFDKDSSNRLKINNDFSKLMNLLGLGQKLLSVRIQLIMASLIFAGLFASVIFTIKYLEVNHNQQTREELLLKINEVVNQIQNEPNLEQKLNDDEYKRLLTSEVSDIHKVEANIFDSEGFLLASSKPEIYNKALFSRWMDPEAFYQMNYRQVSQLIQTEELRGFKYLSAYVPLFNEKKGIIGYLNLPYFIGQTKLNKEISTYTITFVNLYLFLFALALALAYFVSKRITKPLKIIQEKISRTSLGKENEMIEWKGSDEIGQLIKQYNKMVLELEQSANKLSASEREGAWKEMARQVAHEIKNPLTPMKLNIQHLQRAWNDEHPKLEATFKKVTRVLIDQIESLSRLASEFSSFAQMPTDQFSDFNVHQLLNDTVILFERSENVKFIYNKDVGEFNMHGDKEQIGRAFNNLIKNAIQAIPENRSGLIVVEVALERNNLHIKIGDNGVGIDKNTGEQIFVPKFSTKNSGMGLGLAITKKIIENNGGQISFTSVLNKGTTFEIILPLIFNEN